MNESEREKEKVVENGVGNAPDVEANLRSSTKEQIAGKK